MFYNGHDYKHIATFEERTDADHKAEVYKDSKHKTLVVKAHNKNGSVYRVYRQR
jgi:tRNA splicing endonuclease